MPHRAVKPVLVQPSSHGDGTAAKHVLTVVVGRNVNERGEQALHTDEKEDKTGTGIRNQDESPGRRLQIPRELNDKDSASKMPNNPLDHDGNPAGLRRCPDTQRQREDPTVSKNIPGRPRRLRAILCPVPFEILPRTEANVTLASFLFGRKAVKFVAQHRCLFVALDGLTLLWLTYCYVVMPLREQAHKLWDLLQCTAFFLCAIYTAFSFSCVVQMTLLRRCVKGFHFFFATAEISLFSLSIWSSFCFSLAGFLFGLSVTLLSVLILLYDTFSIRTRKKFKMGYFVSIVSFTWLFITVSFRFAPGMCEYRFDLEQGLVLHTSRDDGTLPWTPWSFSFIDLALNTGVTVVALLVRSAVLTRRHAGQQLLLQARLIACETCGDSAEQEHLDRFANATKQKFDELGWHQKLSFTSLASMLTGRQVDVKSGDDRQRLEDNDVALSKMSHEPHEPDNSVHEAKDDTSEATRYPQSEASASEMTATTIQQPSHHRQRGNGRQRNVLIAEMPCELLTDEEAAMTGIRFLMGNLKALLQLIPKVFNRFPIKCRQTSKGKSLANSDKVDRRHGEKDSGRSHHSTGLQKMNASTTLAVNSSTRQTAAFQDIDFHEAAQKKRRFQRNLVRLVLAIADVVIFFAHAISPVVPMNHTSRLTVLSVSVFASVTLLPLVYLTTMNHRVFVLCLNNFETLYFLGNIGVLFIALSSVCCFSMEGVLLSLGICLSLSWCPFYDAFPLGARRSVRLPFLACLIALVSRLTMIHSGVVSDRMCFYRYDFGQGWTVDVVTAGFNESATVHAHWDTVTPASSSSASIHAYFSASSALVIEPATVTSVSSLPPSWDSTASNPTTFLDSDQSLLTPEISVEDIREEKVYSFCLVDVAFNCGFTICVFLLRYLHSVSQNPNACIVLRSSLYLFEIDPKHPAPTMICFRPFIPGSGGLSASSLESTHGPQPRTGFEIDEQNGKATSKTKTNFFGGFTAKKLLGQQTHD